MNKETEKLYCPCGGELTQIGITHTGHTHQCKTCGELHAPFGHTESTERVRFLVALDYDEQDVMDNQREHLKEEFARAKVDGQSVVFYFSTTRYQAEQVRALLRVVAGMDTPLNRDLNMIEEGDKRYVDK